MYKLNTDEINSFNKTGTLLVKNFFKSNDIVKIKNHILKYNKNNFGKKVFKYKEKSLKNNKELLIRVENFYDTDKFLKKIIRTNSIFNTLKSLLKSNPILFKEKINFKPPGSKADKLHQDSQAGWWKYSSNFISLVISVQKSTEKNGCLEFDISGNNSKKLLTKEMKSLRVDKLKKPKFKKFKLNPGDVVFFNSYVPHRSKSNLSNKSRAQIYLTFNKKNEGNFRKKYFNDKKLAYPPNIDRLINKKYLYKV